MAHPGGFEPPTLGFEGLYSSALCPIKLIVCHNTTYAIPFSSGFISVLPPDSCVPE